MFDVGRRVLFLILIGLLSGCQTASEAGADSQTEQPTAAVGKAPEEQSEPFRPYAYEEVPQLKTLVFADGFEAYTSEKPYVLGYSYEGDYVATIIYDAAQEGYIVEVHDTLTNSVAYEAFVPNAERLLKSDSISHDLLTAAQESLDMGYRIRVPPVVNEQTSGVFEQQGAEGNMFRFHLGVEEEGAFRIEVSNQDGQMWVVVNDNTPLNTDQTFIHEYTWAIHPQGTDRVSIMVYTAVEGQPVTPYVYTVNTAALDRRLSEQALNQTLEKWLDHPKIIYRYPSTANAHCVLAVEAEGEEALDATSIYSGRVTEFVLLDRNGEKVVHGEASGVFDREDHLLSAPDEHHHYEITVIPGQVARYAELLVVDIYNGDDDLVQTLEWSWDAKEREFQLIGAEGTE